jgi:penicillin-binding protein 1A
MKVKTKKVARLARKMGVRTPVSSNYAMALGGLRQGVTPLDMAHAYETFATGGKLVYGTLSPGQSKKTLPVPGPVGIERIDQKRKNKWRAVELPDGEKMVNKRKTKRVLDEGITGQVSTLLQNVVKQGTATRAQIPGVMVAGKTGTTENYGDAWFVAWTKEYTVAVWVGYPDEFKPMKTEFQGDPVAGGTYPAGIWKTFMQYLLKIDPLPKKEGGDGTGKDVDPESTPTPGAGTVPAPTATAPPVTPETPPADETAPTTPETPPPTDPEPETPPPTEEQPPPTEEQPPATDPGTGGGEAAPPADDGTG